MLKNIDPSDKSIRPFKAHKNFTLTNNDSGSGHFVLRAVSGSTYNFLTAKLEPVAISKKNSVELKASLRV